MKTLSLMLLFTVISFPLWAQRNVVLIVNESNPISSLSAFQISEMYLKKNRTWPNGEAVRFFDRSDESIERKSFLSSILRRSSRELEQFWIGQKLYTGNSAPSQLSSDKMTFALVSRFPGAIGYILEDNFLENKGIKKIEVTGTP